MDSEFNSEPKKVNQRKEIIIGASIIALAILIYAFLNYDYKLRTLEFEKEKEAQKTRMEEQKKTEIEASNFENKKKYLECIQVIEKSKKEWWNRECKAKGLSDNCQLPFDNIDRINSQTEKQKETCDKLYLTD